MGTLCNVTSPDNKLNHTRCRLITTGFSLFGLLPLINLLVFPYTSYGIAHEMIIFTYPVVLVLFVLTWQVSPGYMKPNKDFDKTIECIARFSSEPHRICPDCLILKPRRSKHCDACGKCVMVFDHHCPFLHNCVGAGNMKYFLPLLLSMAVVLVNSTILVSNGSLMAKLAVIQKNLIPESYFNVFGLENMPPVGQVFFFTALLFFGIVLILASFGVLQLSFVQVVNTLVGRTTSERFGFKAKTNQSTEEEEAAPVMVGSTISSDHQPYSQLQNRPFYRNIIDMLFVNAYVPEFGAKALQ